MISRSTKQKNASARVILILILFVCPTLLLGFDLTRQLPQRRTANDKRRVPGGPIHLSNGRFAIISTDISGSRGGSWEFQRVYKNRPAVVGMLGHNWQMNYMRTLRVQRGGGVEILDSFSGLIKTARQSTNSFRVQERRGGLLTRRPDGTLTEKNNRGQLIEYSAPDRLGVARMTRLVNRYGGRLFFDYTAGGHLRRVTDSAKRALDYIYDNRGVLQQLKASDGRTVRFEYDQALRLNGVVKPNGERVNYRYFNGPASDPRTNRLTSVISSRRTRLGTPIEASFNYSSASPGDPNPGTSATLNIDGCGLWEDFDADGGAGGVLGGDCAGGDCAGLLMGMLHPDLLVWGYKGGGSPSAGCFIVDDDGDDPPPPPPPPTPTPPPPLPTPTPPDCSKEVADSCQMEGYDEYVRRLYYGSFNCVDNWFSAQLACEECQRNHGCGGAHCDGPSVCYSIPH